MLALRQRPHPTRAVVTREDDGTQNRALAVVGAVRAEHVGCELVPFGTGVEVLVIDPCIDHPGFERHLVNEAAVERSTERSEVREAAGVCYEVDGFSPRRIGSDDERAYGHDREGRADLGRLPRYGGCVTDDDLAPGESTEPEVVPAPDEYRDHGEFMAVLSYRPLDGGEVQRIASIGTTEAYARAEVHMAMRQALGQVQTMAPDSPAVRTFIAAASHMHDLRQALGALESADAIDDTTVAGHLRVYAVVAYGRTYGSNARADLATFIEMSPEDAALTARLKTTRNKFAAHSENSMTVTTPILDLQKELDETITIVQVSGITVGTPMPHPFVADFVEMLRRLIDQLQAALQPLKDVVRAELTPEQVAEVFNNPQPLQFITPPVAEWEPSGRRPAYPASHLSPVHMDTGEQTYNASITR